MIIQSRRFGSIDADPETLIRFPQGIIGFPEETQFVLVPHNSGGFLAWLQSTRSPDLALPVVSAHAFGEKYPDVPVEPAARAAGLGENVEEMAVLVVLCAPNGQPATVNLLAPIVVNVATRSGVQLILDGSRFSTRELFVRPVEDAPQPAAQAATP